MLSRLGIAVIACLLTSSAAAVPWPSLVAQRSIVFPTDNWDDCFLDNDNTLPGQCKALRDCPEALRLWDEDKISPKTCYFLKAEQIVCCGEEEAPIRRRRSEIACVADGVVRTTVVHGTPTKPNEFPFMAALGWQSNADNSVWYRCGGALISPKFVLTAAHCAELGSALPSVVRLGGVSLTDSEVKDVKIKRFVVHPAYNPQSSYNDIALVELEESVRNVPACVWSGGALSHNNVTALGYGHTKFGGAASNQLLKADLQLVSNENCQKYYGPDTNLLPNGIAASHICAGDPEHLRDTCQGDSGGPIVWRSGLGNNDNMYVVGVTSFGLGCAGEPPSIYTRTSSYIDWIEDIVWPADSDFMNPT